MDSGRLIQQQQTGEDVSSPGMLSASITRSCPHVSSLTSSQHLRSQGCAVHSQKKGLKMSTDTRLLTGPTEDRDPWPPQTLF